MPTFIVHHKGDSPKFAVVDDPVVTFGRDASCSVVLADRTVSRHHLRMRLYANGSWLIDAVKPENPVIVNGTFVGQAVALEEGAEIQIGDYLVIFSLDQRARDVYLSERKFYEGVCSGCSWTGQIGVRNQQPLCPRCGTQISERKDDLTGVGVQAMPDVVGETAYIPPGGLAQLHEMLQVATKARLEPTSGTPGQPVKLAKEKPCTLGKPGVCDLPVDGLLLGGKATVTWSGEAWTARFEGGLMSGLQVNGTRTREMALKAGDLLQVGKGKYRLVVG